MLDDFGPGRLAGEVAAFTGREPITAPFGLYVFGRATGNVVEHNTFLQGEQLPCDSPPGDGVDATPLVGEFQAGIALEFLKHCEFIYSRYASHA